MDAVRAARYNLEQVGRAQAVVVAEWNHASNFVHPGRSDNKDKTLLGWDVDFLVTPFPNRDNRSLELLVSALLSTTTTTKKPYHGFNNNPCLSIRSCPTAGIRPETRSVKPCKAFQRPDKIASAHPSPSPHRPGQRARPDVGSVTRKHFWAHVAFLGFPYCRVRLTANRRKVFEISWPTAALCRLRKTFEPILGADATKSRGRLPGNAGE
ncbi:hypothetical protein IWX50DRAFT_367902 [Phyllosticta citricarpa]